MISSIQYNDPKELMTANPARIYQIFLTGSEFGVMSWTGNGFDGMDEEHAQFFSIKGIRADIAEAEYDKAYRMARDRYERGNLHLVGIPTFKNEG